MKPLHIALLLAAGAVGGAVVMRISQRPPAPVVAHRVAPRVAPAVARTQATPPATAPSPSPEAPRVVVPPAEIAATGATRTPGAQPSPFESPKIARDATRPGRAHPASPGKANATPEVLAAIRRQSTRPEVPAAARRQSKPEVLASARRQPSKPEVLASARREPTRPEELAAARKQPIEPPPPPPPVFTTPLPADFAPAPEPVPPARTEPEHATSPPPPAPPEPHRVTLNAGTLIPVRLVDGLTSERNLPGDSFTATLDKALVVDGFVIAERGARVEGRVLASDRGGRVKGVSSLQVELVRLHLSDGQSVAMQTDGFVRRAETSRNEDATKVGAGVAIGAIIGAVAGGGKGAAIGAGVGGAAGAGDVLATRGKAATLPSETRVTFRMRVPVTITEKLRDY